MCLGLSSRACLLLLNTAFFLLGAGITGVGLWSEYDKNFSTLWNSLEISKVIDARTLNGASLLMILSGISSIMVSFIGLYGALKKDRCFLTTYCLFMVVILILEVAAASVFLSYQTQTKTKLRAGLNETVEKINDNNDKAALKIMDTIQTVFKCCGCDGPNDYKNLSLIKSCETNDSTPDKPNYYQQGCYNSIVSYINSHLPILISLSIIMIIFQIFCLIASMRVCSGIRYEGYDNI